MRDISASLRDRLVRALQETLRTDVSIFTTLEATKAEHQELIKCGFYLLIDGADTLGFLLEHGESESGGVTVREARAELARLTERVAAGESELGSTILRQLIDGK